MNYRFAYVRAVADARTYDDSVRDHRERDGDRVLEERLWRRRVRVEFRGIGEDLALRARNAECVPRAHHLRHEVLSWSRSEQRGEWRLRAWTYDGHDEKHQHTDDGQPDGQAVADLLAEDEEALGKVHEVCACRATARVSKERGFRACAKPLDDSAKRWLASEDNNLPPAKSWSHRPTRCALAGTISTLGGIAPTGSVR